MMNAMKAQHLAQSRVEQISRSSGVAAAATLESEMVEDLVDPFPGNDVVLATLDPLPLVKDVLVSLDGRTSFEDLHADDRWKLRTQLVELGASVRTLLRQFGDSLAEDRR